jgi:hypothetical protein
VAGAAAAWNGPIAACSAASLKLAPEPAAAYQVAQDGVNSIIFRRGRWCRNGDETQGCYDRGMQAITTLFLRNSPGHRDDGEILEADIELNAVDFRWSGSEVPPERWQPNTVDLQSVLTHELGHVLGLAHPCDEGLVGSAIEDSGNFLLPRCIGGDMPPTVMYPTARAGPAVKRVIFAGETEGICSIYPRRS